MNSGDGFFHNHFEMAIYTYREGNTVFGLKDNLQINLVQLFIKVLKYIEFKETFYE